MTTLGELARLVGGRVVGDASLVIEQAATLTEADERTITFVDGPERLGQLRGSSAAAAVIPVSAATEAETDSIPPALLLVEEPHRAFARIVSHFRPPRTQRRIGISPLAYVSISATLADDVDIHPGAIVGDDVEIGRGSTIHSGAKVMAGCRLGEQVTLMPNVVVYENTLIGERTTIHAGAIIGAFGFGYQIAEGRHERTAQLGHVEIGADVEIGANTTIDRGTYNATTIGEGTKIDNLVMIAHNCRIGRHNLICSQVGVAGSSTTGDYVVLAGQVGVRDHVHIGAGSMVGAMAGVSNSIPEGAKYLGTPATPAREQKLKQAAWSKLPEMRREFKRMQRTVERLQEQIQDLQAGQSDHDISDDQAAA